MSRKLKPAEAEFLRLNCGRPHSEVTADMVRLFGIGVSVKTFCAYRAREGHTGDRKTGLRRGIFTAPDTRVGRGGYLTTRRIVDGKAVWVAKHKADWQDLNGPVPPGMRLVCLGDKTDPRPDNWRLVPHGAATMAALNGPVPIGSAPHEIKPALVSLAELKFKLKGKKS